MYIFNYIHVCYAFQGRSPWWNAEMTCFICFCNSSFNQPWGLVTGHVYSLLQMFSEVREKHLQKSLPIMKLKGDFWRKLRWIRWDSFGNLEGLGQWLHLRSRCLEISYHKIAVLLRKNCNFCMTAWCQVVANHPKCQFHIAYASQICHDRI